MQRSFLITESYKVLSFFMENGDNPNLNHLVERGDNFTHLFFQCDNRNEKSHKAEKRKLFFMKNNGACIFSFFRIQVYI